MKATHDEVLAILLREFPGTVEFYTQADGLPAIKFLGYPQRQDKRADGRMEAGWWFTGGNDYLNIKLSNQGSRSTVPSISISIHNGEASIQLDTRLESGPNEYIEALYEIMVDQYGWRMVNTVADQYGNRYAKHYPGNWRYNLARALRDWIEFTRYAESKNWVTDFSTFQK